MTKWYKSSLGEVVNALDCHIISEFELQSRYYIQLQTNTNGKGMKSLIPSDMC